MKKKIKAITFAAVFFSTTVFAQAGFWSSLWCALQATAESLACGVAVLVENGWYITVGEGYAGVGKRYGGAQDKTARSLSECSISANYKSCNGE